MKTKHEIKNEIKRLESKLESEKILRQEILKLNHTSIGPDMMVRKTMAEIEKLKWTLTK